MISKKIYYDINFIGYPKDKIYSLAYDLGRELSEYLGVKAISLLLDSHSLILPQSLVKLPYYIKDRTYQLHSAGKTLEYFLKKLIKRKKLNENPYDEIGHVFGERSSKLKAKIKDRKLIAKTKAVWDYSRNSVMHYSDTFNEEIRYHDYEEIVKLIISLYKDFYGKTEPDDEIKKGWQEYVISKYLGPKG